ncbi:MAG TPA: hypothetical protein VHZ74_00095 [Bryobacteraceae bacterium]|nr:hypothetical protein [Bryobacteraceae bacterium]
MTKIAGCSLLSLTAIVLSSASLGAMKGATKRTAKEAGGPAVLWENPTDISTRDMINGAGGAAHQPKGPFRFVKEDRAGSNPKYVVTDVDGVKWKIKLGEEAHPETVASRIVWAAGYFTDEDYFVPDLKVDGVPSNLKRGENKVEPDGLMHNARLERYQKGEEKDGIWQWKDNPFTGTREFNGLRVLMAVINNWDLKDVNNAIVQADGRRIYMISDLGATFGTTGHEYSRAASKGNLENYTDSKFITKTTPPTVSFAVPGRPQLLTAVDISGFKGRVDMEWIGKDIPIEDARWMGSILAKLSPQQIQSAFGAAGYSPKQVVGFSAVLEGRIAELNRL